MVLLLIAIGLTPAFKMKFWNIGAEGQILVGGAATAALMIYAGDSLPTPVLMILMFVASMAAGIIWGIIPAIFKAYFNTNETLFTLMLNYVAMQIVTFCIVYWEKSGRVQYGWYYQFSDPRRMAAGTGRTDIRLECHDCSCIYHWHVYLYEIQQAGL